MTLSEFGKILLRMVAVFAATGLSVVGAGAVAGVETAQAVLMAGIGGVAAVVEGLARAFLKDGKLDDAEINAVFAQASKKEKNS
jgi:hypothetical protein